MITLYECFEQRKAQLTAAINQNRRPANAIIQIQETLDQVLYKYMNSSDDDHLNAEAAYMVNIAKTSFPLIESVNETKIWVHKSGEKPQKKGLSTGFTLFLILGLISLAAFVAYIFPMVSSFETKKLGIALGIFLLGLLCFFFAGMMLNRKEKLEENVDYKADLFVNTDDIVRRLTAVILQIDKNLQSIKDEEEDEPLVGDDKEFPPKMLDMYASLLEGKYSDDGEFALEQLNEVIYYLHSLGIKLVDYSAETEGQFEFLPSTEKPKTIVPAMVYNGKLIRRGLATKKE